MATAIISILLIMVCVLAVVSYRKKFSRGRCGSGGDTVENAFHTAGEFYAKVNFGKKTATIQAKSDTPEETLKKIILRTGYDVAGISKIGSDVESSIKIFP